MARLVASRRILVLGSSGSGKTTLSIRLGRLLKLPLIHLDACFWQPGWRSTPQAEWRIRVTELVQRESWIMDGTYESTLDVRLPVADSIIVIDQSRLVCLWRVLKRKWSIDDHRRPDAPAGQKLDLDFLRYIWQYPRVTRSKVDDSIRLHAAEKTLIRLRGERQQSAFLHQLQNFMEPP